jgi:ankyrin repeat protein
MFPSPQAALPLPPRPDLKKYKKLAKNLVKACRSNDPSAIRSWASQWVEALVKLSGLSMTADLPVSIDRWVDQVESFARKQLSGSEKQGMTCTASRAQFVIARSHGFESWPKFANFLEMLSHQDSTASAFEAAADAIIFGDIAKLDRLLRENPNLIRTRSAREHRATLLHYISANGVEGYRQKTPKNIVEIAKALLKAGADVNAACDVYDGSTTLGLAASSLHPERAGVQNELLQVLLDCGAETERRTVAGHRHSTVRGCLANGRGKAAEFLATRGVRLDLEEAAGTGRLESVKSFFNDDGSLKPAATKEQLQRGFLWACEYGHNDVVAFLLDHGADMSDQAGTGETGLHWAVVGAQLPTIKLLIERGARLEELNAYGGTTLGQAGWSFINGDPEIDYVPVFEALLAAGAKIEDGWLTWLENQNGRPAVAKALVANVMRHYGART